MALLVGGTFAGCESTPAARTNQRQPEDDFPPDRVLDSSDASRVIAIMDAAQPPGLQLRDPTIPTWPRWSDVPVAMGGACSANEMAVVSRTAGEDRYVFTIRTILNYPGEIAVERIDQPPGYRASGWIGRFPDQAALEKLLATFDERMEALRTRPALADFMPPSES